MKATAPAASSCWPSTSPVALLRDVRETIPHRSRKRPGSD
jgi:hypothetical protein